MNPRERVAADVRALRETTAALSARVERLIEQRQRKLAGERSRAADEPSGAEQPAAGARMSGRFGPFEVPGVRLDHARPASDAGAVSVVVPTPVSTEQAAALLYGTLDSGELASYTPAQVRGVLADLVVNGGSCGISDATFQVDRDRQAGTLNQTAHWRDCQRVAAKATEGWAAESHAAAKGRFGPFEVPEVRMDHHQLAGEGSGDRVVRVSVPVPLSTEQAAALLYDSLSTEDAASCGPAELRRQLVDLVAGGGSLGVSDALGTVAQERAGGELVKEHWQLCRRLARELSAEVAAAQREAAEQAYRSGAGSVLEAAEDQAEDQAAAREDQPGGRMQAEDPGQRGLSGSVSWPDMRMSLPGDGHAPAPDSSAATGEHVGLVCAAANESAPDQPGQSTPAGQAEAGAPEPRVDPGAVPTRWAEPEGAAVLPTVEEVEARAASAEAEAEEAEAWADARSERSRAALDRAREAVRRLVEDSQARRGAHGQAREQEAARSHTADDAEIAADTGGLDTCASTLGGA